MCSPHITQKLVGSHRFKFSFIFNKLKNLFDGLLNPDYYPVIPILSRINPIIRINSYSFQIHSNIYLPTNLRFSRRPLSFRLSLAT